jgi:hypothetical protein
VDGVYPKRGDTIFTLKAPGALSAVVTILFWGMYKPESCVWMIEKNVGNILGEALWKDRRI